MCLCVYVVSVRLALFKVVLGVSVCLALFKVLLGCARYLCLSASYEGTMASVQAPVTGLRNTGCQSSSESV